MNFTRKWDWLRSGRSVPVPILATTPLPARVVPLPGESLVSLVRRTAAVMGYAGPHRLRALIVDVGKVQANVNVLRPGPILDVLAVLLRQPPETLLSMTVHRLAPTLVFPGEPSQPASLCDSKTTLKFFSQGEFPVCPACLRQDTAPYERLAWSLHALPACREHRSHLLGRYAGGHLSRKVCLFQRPEDRRQLQDRAWITQTEVAVVLKLRTGAIPQLIQHGILTGQVQPAGNHGRSVGLVLRESVENLQRDLQSAVSVAEAATRLGIGPAAVRDLIHDGVLARVVRTQHGWRIPVSSLSTLEALLQQTPTSKPPGGRWLLLREATRIFGPSGITLSRLLDLVQSGKVTSRLANPEQRLHGLVISLHDVESVLPEVRQRQRELRGYPVHRLAKTLFPGRPTKVDVLKKWIDAGLLQAQQVGRARMVMPDEISRFHHTYCLRDEAARLLGISSNTLSSWVRAGRVLPAYPPRG